MPNAVPQGTVLQKHPCLASRRCASSGEVQDAHANRDDYALDKKVCVLDPIWDLRLLAGVRRNQKLRQWAGILTLRCTAGNSLRLTGYFKEFNFRLQSSHVLNPFLYLVS